MKEIPLTMTLVTSQRMKHAIWFSQARFGRIYDYIMITVYLALVVFILSYLKANLYLFNIVMMYCTMHITYKELSRTYYIGPQLDVMTITDVTD